MRQLVGKTFCLVGNFPLICILKDLLGNSIQPPYLLRHLKLGAIIHKVCDIFGLPEQLHLSLVEI